MPLLSILIVILVVGVLLWIINSFIPMDSKIKQIFNIVVVIALVVWLLKAFGVLAYLTNVQI
ncbi:Thivi_2564 family membrane protein [Sunxiuqinia indica]|uniref:Thivi_2564 family membrane protein n=1 Tax=Sunxiuqinia indica TaxID=2692584 RepID=UPI003742C300